MLIVYKLKFIKMSYLKKLLAFFLIFNLTFVTTAQATTTFVRSFDVSLLNNDPVGIVFNNNGSKMYLTDVNNNHIETYNLTTPFNLATANDALEIHTVGGGMLFGVAFNTLGSVLYYYNLAENNVIQVNLTTNFDVSVGVNNGACDTAPEIDTGGEITFNTDGSKMFIMDRDLGDDVNEYSLGLPFDLTTCNFTRSFSVINEIGNHNEADAPGIAFNADGTKMFIAGRVDSTESRVWEYILSTAFDVSTASFADSINVTNQDNQPQGISFNNDGTKMFLTGSENDNVYEYILTTGFDLNLADSDADSAADESSEATLPDPTTDKYVVGLIDTQSQLIKSFMLNSIGSISNRLSNTRCELPQDRLKSKTELCINKSKQSSHNIKLNFGNAILTSLSNELLAKNNKSLLPDNWSTWSEGSLSVTKIGDSATSSSSEIDSQGLALGFDKKLDNNDTLGFALQYGQSDADVGSNGTNSDSENYNLSVYRTRPLDDNHFIEGMLGVGAIESDLTRASGANTLTGSRDGTQIFGSINYGKIIDKGEFNLTPIARIDLGYTELDSYTETGTNALSYDKQTIESGLASLGLEINNIVKFSNSSLKPYGSLEYGLDFSNSSDAKMNYVSDTTTIYTHKNGANSNHLITSKVGLEYLAKDNLNILTSYKRIQGNESEHTDTVSLSLKFKSKQETNYAMSLDGSEDLKAGFDVTKNINGFDLSFNADQSLSERDQQAKVSLSRKF